MIEFCMFSEFSAEMFPDVIAGFTGMSLVFCVSATFRSRPLISTDMFPGAPLPDNTAQSPGDDTAARSARSLWDANIHLNDACLGENRKFTQTLQTSLRFDVNTEAEQWGALRSWWLQMTLIRPINCEWGAVVNTMRTITVSGDDQILKGLSGKSQGRKKFDIFI